VLTCYYLCLNIQIQCTIHICIVTILFGTCNDLRRIRRYWPSIIVLLAYSLIAAYDGFRHMRINGLSVFVFSNVPSNQSDWLVQGNVFKAKCDRHCGICVLENLPWEGNG
jgi:hypothetical protein